MPANRLNQFDAVGGRGELVVVPEHALTVASAQTAMIAKTVTALPFSHNGSDRSTVENFKATIHCQHENVTRFYEESATALNKAVYAARAAGEALVELKKLVGRGKWSCVKQELANELNTGETTLSLYMRVYLKWAEILAETQAGEVGEFSLRRVANLLCRKRRGKSPRKLPQASYHIICQDIDLARVIKGLEGDGYAFHSTNVAITSDGVHLFMVNGVRGDIAPATCEFKTWIEVRDRKEAAAQLADRLTAIWPGAQCKSFSPFT